MVKRLALIGVAALMAATVGVTASAKGHRGVGYQENIQAAANVVGESVESMIDRLQEYRLEYRTGGTWNLLYEGKAPTGLRVKIHRFDTVWGDAVRMTVLNSNGTTSIAEFGVYCERR